MTDAVVSAILSYGAPGIIIAILLAALRWVFQKYDAAQEARIEEGKEIAKIATASAAALEVANRNTTLVLAELETCRQFSMSVGVIPRGRPR